MAVPDGDAVVPVINHLAKQFKNVVITQDWHPLGHLSFASAHPGKQPFDTIKLPYGTQVLWPDHCVQGSVGAELHPDLAIPQAQLILRKGYNMNSDSYSAFLEANGTDTGLAAYLKARGITRVFLAGVATDYCVGASAEDARRLAFKAVVVEDACRGIAQDTIKAAWDRMRKAGVERAKATDIRSGDPGRLFPLKGEFIIEHKE